MASLADVRSIALALPGVEEQALTQGGGAGWRTRAGLVVWERGASARDRQQLAELGREFPAGTVVAIRTEDQPTVSALLEEDPDVFFTIPHFAGYPGILVRLGPIGVPRLRELITDAWLVRTPKRVAAAWLADHPLPAGDACPTERRTTSPR